MLYTDFNNYEAKLTQEYIEELFELYEYISRKLKEKIIAEKIINKIEKKALSLEYMPERYTKIKKLDELKLEYHRVVINNFVLLYTINSDDKEIYISRIIYGKRNYLK